MGSLKEKLLSVAETRTDFVEIDDERFVVREVGAIEFAEYGSLLKTDRVKATATLLASCIMDEESGGPMLTVEEATVLARSARTSMPFVNKIMELSGFRDNDEKEIDAD